MRYLTEKSVFVKKIFILSKVNAKNALNFKLLMEHTVSVKKDSLKFLKVYVFLAIEVVKGVLDQR